MVELFSTTGSHYEDPVAIDHCCQPMCDHQHCAVFENVVKSCLDEVVSLKIDVGGGLIEHQDLRVPDHRATKADQLLLTN